MLLSILGTCIPLAIYANHGPSKPAAAAATTKGPPVTDQTVAAAAAAAAVVAGLDGLQTRSLAPPQPTTVAHTHTCHMTSPPLYTVFYGISNMTMNAVHHTHTHTHT